MTGSYSADNLREILANQEAVLLCGAGISLDPPAGLPDWHLLRDRTIRAVAMRHPPLVSQGEALAAIPMLALPGKRGLTPEVVASEIAHSCAGYFESFRSLEDGTPNANHQWIAAAARAGFLRFVVTTNFDLFIERALEAMKVSFKVYRTIDEFDGFGDEREAQVHLLKLHGCLSVPSTITATVEQEAIGLDPAKARAMDRLLPSRWLVAWGYSGADLKIDLDYLRMVSQTDRASGFVWNLFARAGHREEPNPFVRQLADLYAQRAAIGYNVVPDALAAIVPASEQPAALALDQEQRGSWQSRKNERLGALLDDWAAGHVTPHAACVIVGDLLEHAGLWQAALSCFEEAEELARRAGDPAARETAVLNGSTLLIKVGRFGDAEQALDEMVANERRTGQGLTAALALKGDIAAARGQVEQAYASYQEARTLAAAAGSETELVRHLLVSMATLERGRGRLEESMSLYEQAEDAYRQAGNKGRLAESLQGKADIHAKWGEYDMAEAAANEAREIAAMLGDRQRLSAALLQLGQIALARRDWDGAHRLLETADEHAVAIGDQRHRAIVLGAKASLAWNRGDRREAVAIHEELVELLRSSDEPRMLGNELSNLANSYSGLGREAEAEQCLTESYELLRNSGDHIHAAIVAGDLARKFAVRGDAARAYSHFEWSMAHLRALGRNDEVPPLLDELRPILSQVRGGPEWTLREALERALQRTGTAQEEFVGLAARDPNLGDVAGDVQSLAALLERRMSLGHAVLALSIALKNHTQRLLDGGDFAGVVRWSGFGFELCWIAGDDHAAGIFLNDAGFASRKLGNQDRAADLLQAAARYASFLGDNEGLAVRYWNLAQARLEAGRAAEALEAARAGAAAAGHILDVETRMARFVSMGDIFLELRAWDDCIDAFSKGLNDARWLGDRPTAARCYQGRGKAWRELGHVEQSAADRVEAARLYAQTGDRGAAAGLAFLAGHTYQLLPDRLTEALSSYEQAVVLARSAGLGDIVREGEARLSALRGRRT